MRASLDSTDAGSSPIIHAHSRRTERIQVRLLAASSTNDTRAAVRDIVGREGWEVRNWDDNDSTTAHPDLAEVVIVVADNVSPSVLLDVARAARRRHARVVVLSRDRDPRHLSDALHAGADDYVHFPFSADELVARIRALASRPRANAVALDSREATLDAATRSVVDGKQRVQLTVREWHIITCLAGADGQPVSALQLSLAVAGAPIRAESIASIVSRLRKKLNEHCVTSFRIVPVRGNGYVLRRTPNPDA